LETSARFVLVVEKEATFRHMLAIGFTRTHGPCGVADSLWQGKGYPDLSTRRLLRVLSETVRITAHGAAPISRSNSASPASRLDPSPFSLADADDLPFKLEAGGPLDGSSPRIPFLRMDDEDQLESDPASDAEESCSMSWEDFEMSPRDFGSLELPPSAQHLDGVRDEADPPTAESRPRPPFLDFRTHNTIPHEAREPLRPQEVFSPVDADLDQVVVDDDVLGFAWSPDAADDYDDDDRPDDAHTQHTIWDGSEPAHEDGDHLDDDHDAGELFGPPRECEMDWDAIIGEARGLDVDDRGAGRSHAVLALAPAREEDAAALVPVDGNAGPRAAPSLQAPGAKLRVLALVDSDPHGINIFICYRAGSLVRAPLFLRSPTPTPSWGFGGSSPFFHVPYPIRNSFLIIYSDFKATCFDTTLATPTLELVGLRPSDWARTAIPPEQLLPLTERDKAKARKLIASDVGAALVDARRDLQGMLHNNAKCELQALDGGLVPYIEEKLLGRGVLWGRAAGGVNQ
ncbi:hypothetical protein BDK51DRAFT_25762, partial [Blyttiomyces helicus]